ncbi:pirin-like C-terminal cupin domain-containing protein [Streptomyces sp. NPDC058239]|uniref:pirin-like C-terminal cupin domain-containing protein n=1 Tax=unclassified Streptomyces TaxID=2593676 RepID=UPI003668832C
MPAITVDDILVLPMVTEAAPAVVEREVREVSAGLFHGVRWWVNLPSRLKTAPPRYGDIRRGEAAPLSSADGGALPRVIAGEMGGRTGPGITRAPISLAHVYPSRGARLRPPWRPDFNAPACALPGSGSVGAGPRPARKGQIAVYGGCGVVTVAAAAEQDSRSPQSEVLVLVGKPPREPVAVCGPFVMNTRQELYKASEDDRAGRLGSIPAESDPVHDVL